MRVFPHFATAIVLAHALIATTAAQKHPYYDDKGTLQWHTMFDAAKAAAKKADKLIFLEVGANT